MNNLGSKSIDCDRRLATDLMNATSHKYITYWILLKVFVSVISRYCIYGRGSYRPVLHITSKDDSDPLFGNPAEAAQRNCFGQETRLTSMSFTHPSSTKCYFKAQRRIAQESRTKMSISYLEWVLNLIISGLD